VDVERIAGVIRGMKPDMSRGRRSIAKWGSPGR
jgi:hypothetical protein